MKGDCVIIDFVRTPLCAMGGSLKSRTSDELAQASMEAVMKRTGIESQYLDHVICGHAHMDTNPYNLARTAWLLTRLDENIPGYTVHACGASGLLALQKAYYLFKTENDLTALVGGAESYSNAPYVLRNARYGINLQKFPVTDSIGEGECWTQPQAMDPRMLAEKLAKQRGYSHQQIEETIARDRGRSDTALWKDYCIPVCWEERKKGKVCVSEDAPGEAESSFPPYCDGSAMMLACEEERAAELGFHPVARVLGFSSGACAPENRWEGAVKSVNKLLKKHAEIKPASISAVEIIADSAISTLAITEELEQLGFERNAINRLGGCMAFGVNEGADGVVAAERCLLNLNQTGGRYGIVAAAAAGGQGMAMLLENL